MFMKGSLIPHTRQSRKSLGQVIGRIGIRETQRRGNAKRKDSVSCHETPRRTSANLCARRPARSARSARSPKRSHSQKSNCGLVLSGNIIVSEIVCMNSQFPIPYFVDDCDMSHGRSAWSENDSRQSMRDERLVAENLSEHSDSRIGVSQVNIASFLGRFARSRWVTSYVNDIAVAPKYLRVATCRGRMKSVHFAACLGDESRFPKELAVTAACFTLAIGQMHRAGQERSSERFRRILPMTRDDYSGDRERCNGR
jgi:hypothetical protein